MQLRVVAGTHSPATRFIPIGSDIAEGIAAGITNGTANRYRNGITIDSDPEEAYYGDTLKSEQMTGEFPVLGSVNTAVSRTGNVRSVSVMPRWVSL